MLGRGYMPSPSLLLALLSLVLGGVVAGLLLLWAFTKMNFAKRTVTLGTSARRQP